MLVISGVYRPCPHPAECCESSVKQYAASHGLSLGGMWVQSSNRGLLSVQCSLV